MKSAFRKLTLAFLATTLCLPACGNDSVDGWQFGEPEQASDSPEPDTSGESTADAGDPIPAHDGGDAPPDMGTHDSGPADTDVHPGELVTRKGWYTQLDVVDDEDGALSEREFLPVDALEDLVFADTTPGGPFATCSRYLTPLGEGSMDVVTTDLWPGVPEPISLRPNGGFVGYMALTGTRTSETDAPFFVRSGEVFPCETAAIARHCGIPRLGDVCANHRYDDTQVWSEQDPTSVDFEKTSISTDGLTYTYELEARFGEDTGDGRTDVVFRFETSQPTLSFFEMKDFDAVSLGEERHWLGYSEVDFSNDLGGWIERDPTADAEAFFVSVSGVSDDGEELHLWGHFTVTMTHHDADE